MKFTSQQIKRYKRIKRLEQMQKMDPVDFEHFCGWLYQKDGYKVGDTVVTGDEGVDLELRKRGRKVIVQCKRYSGTVGQPTVRDLYGAMFHTGSKEAHLVTTGKISRQAENWAAGKPIELIDGHDLVAWVNRKRRDSKQSQGARVMWITAGGLLLFVLGLTVAALVGGWLFFGARTNVVDPETIAATLGAQAAAEAVDEEQGSNLSEEEQEAPTPTIQIAPTATIEGTPIDDQNNVVASFTDTPPVLDGSLGDWEEVAVFRSPHRVYNLDDWDRTEDNNALWRVLWDDDYLYLGVRVIDDQHVQVESGAAVYLGDSLELQIDTDRDKDYEAGVSPDDYQIEFSPGNFAELSAEAVRFQGNANNALPELPGDNISIVSSRQSDGYIIEARIPWVDIGVRPRPDLVFGANFNVNDNDTIGSSRQEVMYSNVATRSYRNPTTWGTLTLDKQ